jgi:hypothetical protein
MERSTTFGYMFLGICVGLGIYLAAIVTGHALHDIRAADRFVSVKGLAEQDVDADLAIWPLTFEEAGNSLPDIQKTIDDKREVIRRFLIDAGFKAEEISQSAPQIRDLQANMYYGEKTAIKYRYASQSTVTLRSASVTLVKQTMEKSGALVGKGIALAADSYGRNTEFLYTKLNDIKPGMIAEATQNARKAAEQFARDSGSEVGKIRGASQGLFTISNRDINSPDKKTIRVVTTVDYFLVDR